MRKEEAEKDTIDTEDHADPADVAVGKDDGLSFIQGMELLLYGGRQPSDRMQKEAEKDYEILRRRLIQEKGKLKAAFLLFSHI